MTTSAINDTQASKNPEPGNYKRPKSHKIWVLVN